MAAYDVRISDWGSDVCSSDLFLGLLLGFKGPAELAAEKAAQEAAEQAAETKAEAEVEGEVEAGPAPASKSAKTAAKSAEKAKAAQPKKAAPGPVEDADKGDAKGSVANQSLRVNVEVLEKIGRAHV